MTNKKSSKIWHKTRAKDVFFQSSKIAGLRSRAAYKLSAIIDKDKMIQAGDTVLDLGSSPGGFSQIARRAVGKSGRVIACDILEMRPLDGVIFVRGDFLEMDVYRRILRKIGDRGLDVLLSDMAPNMSGQRSVDIPKAMHLAECAFDMAAKTLSAEGRFLVKLFHGEGFDDFVAKCRGHFQTVAIRKPEASKKTSREVYLLAHRPNFR